MILSTFLPFLEDVLGLVLSERKSFMPLTYIVLILMAYFGPNAKLFGNIRLAIWQFQQPIEDIVQYVMNVGLLLVVDFLSFFINGVLLWYFANINLLKVLKQLQKDFWIVFSIAEAFLLMQVLCRFMQIHTDT